MNIGLKKDEIVLVPYEQAWQAEFAKTKNELLRVTNLQSNQIEHIGSTSIEGMRAKPIIDLLVGVEDVGCLEKSFFKGLLQAGFHRLRVERPNEIVCAKFTDNTFQIKTHYIHLVQYKGQKWQELLFFRDYLRRNDAAKKQYEQLKLSFFETGLQGIGAYTNYKEEFVKAVLAKKKDDWK
ncbi:GrpB family protein [Metasolibacillus meyeri]|uniref:GrpB family protein n=1 Tax=Metasolibacillus meyeri TaxID=1071052 RepID=UPI000D2F6288|nr:GrpB family protein [Metasolibacillus meyeri]